MTLDRTEHDFNNVTRLDEAPKNGVIFSPDGRVFMDMSPIIMKMTEDTIMRVLASKLGGGPDETEKLKGVHEVLANLNTILTTLEEQNKSELAEKGITVTGGTYGE